MKIAKALFLIGIVMMPIGFSAFVSLDDDDTLYELLESMNEEEEEEDDDENKHKSYEFFLEFNDDREVLSEQLVETNIYFTDQLFKSVKLEVQTPPPRA